METMNENKSTELTESISDFIGRDVTVRNGSIEVSGRLLAIQRSAQHQHKPSVHILEGAKANSLNKVSVNCSERVEPLFLEDVCANDVQSRKN